MTAQMPWLAVVRGEPSDTELAAVVTVLAARLAARAVAAGSSRSEWASRNRLVRQPVYAGPGAWRATARRS